MKKPIMSGYPTKILKECTCARWCLPKPIRTSMPICRKWSPRGLFRQRITTWISMALTITTRTGFFRWMKNTFWLCVVTSRREWPPSNSWRYLKAYSTKSVTAFLPFPVTERWYMPTSNLWKSMVSPSRWVPRKYTTCPSLCARRSYGKPNWKIYAIMAAAFHTVQRMCAKVRRKTEYTKSLPTLHRRMIRSLSGFLRRTLPM